MQRWRAALVPNAVPLLGGRSGSGDSGCYLLWQQRKVVAMCCTFWLLHLMNVTNQPGVFGDGIAAFGTARHCTAPHGTARDHMASQLGGYNTHRSPICAAAKSQPPGKNTKTPTPAAATFVSPTNSPTKPNSRPPPPPKKEAAKPLSKRAQSRKDKADKRNKHKHQAARPRNCLKIPLLTYHNIRLNTSRYAPAAGNKVQRDVAVVDDFLYTPDARFLITVTHQTRTSLVVIRDAEPARRNTQEQTLHLLDPDRGGHNTFTSALACSRDGGLLATGGHDGTLFVWHIETGTRLLNLAKEGQSADTIKDDGITSLEFTSDGSHLISCDETGAVSVWKMVFTKQLHPKVLRQLVIFASAGGLEPAPFRAPELRFDRDGKEDISKYLTEAQTYEEVKVDLAQIMVHKMDGFLHFSNMDFTWLSRAQSDVARVAADRLQNLRQQNWKPTNVYQGSFAEDSPVLGLCLSNDGKVLVTMALDSIRVYSLDLTYKETLQFAIELDIGTIVVNTMLSACNKWLFIGSFNADFDVSHMYIINLKTHEVAEIESEDEGVIFQYPSLPRSEVLSQKMQFANSLPIFVQFTTQLTAPDKVQVLIAYVCTFEM